MKHFKHGFFKDGERPTRLYYVWSDMKRRCFNRKHRAWENYGRRGISVCNEWLDYGVFRNWAIVNGYDIGLTLERINNNGNYEPGNCKWATRIEQNYNKRNNVMMSLNGITMSLQQWANKLGITKQTIQSRRRCGWTDEEILTIPIGGSR